MKIKLSSLPLQILIAVAAGILLGLFLQPAEDGTSSEFRTHGLKFAGFLKDVFLKLIKMVLAPLLLCVVAAGMAGMGDAKKVGRVGGKSILYFEVVTTFALALGLVAVNVLRPGDGVDAGKIAANDANEASKAQEEVAKSKKNAEAQTTLEFLAGVVPENVAGALASGNLLQVLFFAVLLGMALSKMGPRAAPVAEALRHGAEALLQVVALIIRVSPFGVFGAMAFAVGKYGVATLMPLLNFMAVVYLTMVVFVVVVLGGVCRLCGVSLARLLAHIREEIVLVLGMSSSEAALPRLMEKMERFGCPRPIVGLVVPTGYSFNLDGTSIYLTIAAVFIAQVYGISLSWGQQLTILGVLMVTSKGSAAVTGGGFVTLAATLEATHVVPVEGLALIIGVDRFLSEARATVNLIGNAVACVVVSKWEGEFDPDRPIGGMTDIAAGAHPANPAEATDPPGR